MARTIYPEQSLRRLAVFVDWHNTRDYLIPDTRGMRSEDVFRRVIGGLYQETARQCAYFSGSDRFRCRLRLYHGWYVKKQQVPDRRQFERAITSRPDYYRWATKRVAFPDYPEFADKVSIDDRYGTLFNTHRGTERQKMVDTGLVVDALSMLYSDHIDIALIVSNDDDFVPAMIAAEASALRLFLLRPNARDLSEVSNLTSDRVLGWRTA